MCDDLVGSGILPPKRFRMTFLADPAATQGVRRDRAITRVPLRDQVHHAIIERILRDELKSGARISDTALARELGVSRTPIREALLRLEREGFLEADLGRGFFVKPLSVREVREAYPVLWTLEVLALRGTGALTPERRAALDRINDALEGEQDPERRIDLDGEWHRTLLEPCGNDYLMAMIASLKSIIRRYEYAYMQNAGYIPVSTRTHDEIAEMVSAGDVEGAVPLLETNWRFTMKSLLEWLHQVV
jgi:DNA-binding GntR family transcriptional regulator